MNRWLNGLRGLLVCLAAVIGNALVSNQSCAQSGLREALERLDTNQDGTIDPDEISPLARPYLERITRARRMSIDRPNEIDKLQEAARTYAAQRNGVSGRDVRPQGESSVKPFGPDPDSPLVPGFGLARVKYPYTQDDLDFADRIIDRYDRNGDGYIDRAEAARNRWTHRDPFDDDLDKDNRLSRLEMGQRYARRRLLEGASDELVKKAWRTGSGVRPSQREEDKRDDSQWWRRGGSETWLTASIMGRFDSNRNGRLESAEVESLGMPVSQIDIDRDGEVTRQELQRFVMELQEEAGESEALPSWFYELDADRDGQVEMSEFATEWTDQKLQEFAALDTNGDALLTATEVVRSKAMVGGAYRNQNAAVLAPRKTIISEIEVSEDYPIGDLNVEISITHSHASYLDGYLTGPDGQRIELFTEVGGSGDNFDQTLLDDQSRYPINKAKPPFKGRFIPEGLLNRQPSLSHFNGQSVKGVWQLVLRGTRNDRFGMLHGWGLIVQPQEGPLGVSAAVPAQDGPRATDGPPAPAGRTSLPVVITPQTDSRGREGGWKIDMKSLLEGGRIAVDWEGGSRESGGRDGGDKEDREKKIAKYKEWLESQKFSKEQFLKQGFSNEDFSKDKFSKGKFSKEKLSEEKVPKEKFSEEKVPTRE